MLGDTQDDPNHEATHSTGDIYSPPHRDKMFLIHILVTYDRPNSAMQGPAEKSADA